MIEILLRDLTPRVVGAIARRYGDFPTAEDAVQEALIAAVTQWPDEGIPANPAGWLYQVAARRMTDLLRADAARRRREARVVTWLPDIEPVVPPPDDPAALEIDDSLTVLFLSCHPSLTPASAIALTLRAVGGLTTAEIASAFFVPEATMAQRISRAKQTIRNSGGRFEEPAPDELDARLATVLQVLYLIFNEGYTASRGEALHRIELSDEAIRLARMLHCRVTGQPEVSGLLALMLLTDARRAARTGALGELIPLNEQDRALWNRSAIEEGTALVTAAFAMRRPGPYQLQAAIAALHDEAHSIEATDWIQIRALYEALMACNGTPMVRLNHAIAVAMVDGPDAGLALLDSLEREGQVGPNHRVLAARAHLHERAGRVDEARTHFLAAAARAGSEPERRYLFMKAAAPGNTTPAR